MCTPRMPSFSLGIADLPFALRPSPELTQPDLSPIPQSCQYFDDFLITQTLFGPEPDPT